MEKRTRKQTKGRELGIMDQWHNAISVRCAFWEPEQDFGNTGKQAAERRGWDKQKSYLHD